MERAGANELLGSAHSQVRGGRGFASLVRLDRFPQVVVNSCFFRLGCWARAHGAARGKPRSSQLIVRSRLLPRQQRVCVRHLAGACGGVGGFSKSRRRAPGVFCFLFSFCCFRVEGHHVKRHHVTGHRLQGACGAPREAHHVTGHYVKGHDVKGHHVTRHHVTGRRLRQAGHLVRRNM